MMIIFNWSASIYLNFHRLTRLSSITSQSGSSWKLLRNYNQNRIKIDGFSPSSNVTFPPPPLFPLLTIDVDPCWLLVVSATHMSYTSFTCEHNIRLIITRSNWSFQSTHTFSSSTTRLRLCLCPVVLVVDLFFFFASQNSYWFIWNVIKNLARANLRK